MLTVTEVCLYMSALVKDQGIWASLQRIHGLPDTDGGQWCLLCHPVGLWHAFCDNCM